MLTCRSSERMGTVLCNIDFLVWNCSYLYMNRRLPPALYVFSAHNRTRKHHCTNFIQRADVLTTYKFLAMENHRVFGYKTSYDWILARAKEMGVEPENDSLHERSDAIVWTIAILAAQVGLASQVVPIAVKGKFDGVALCIASTDPTDGVPLRVRDNEKIARLQRLVGADGPPNWWWRD